MSLRGWAGSLATAIAVSAAAGAAQLGMGYGLGIFSWLPTVHGADEAAWLASLAWSVWISALSVVLGTVVADRTGMPSADFSPIARLLWRVTLALSASLGGLLVVVLAAIPARVAQRSDTFAPHLIVGGYATTGVLVGLLLAIAAVSVRAMASNVIATGIWLWLLAAVATGDLLASGRDLKVAQLGVWQPTADGPWLQSVYLPGAVLSAGAALIIGACAAWPAARRRANLAGVALSGAAGPALVGIAYLLAAPRLVDVLPQQLSAHLITPYAVVAGLLGSLLVALATAQRRQRRPARPVASVRKPREQFATNAAS
jgi:hypothetical protein